MHDCRDPSRGAVRDGPGRVVLQMVAAARCTSGDELALKIEGFVGRRHARSGSVRRIELIRTAVAGARLFRPNVRATIARPR
jgi:hypothetical protein